MNHSQFSGCKAKTLNDQANFRTSNIKKVSYEGQNKQSLTPNNNFKTPINPTKNQYFDESTRSIKRFQEEEDQNHYHYNNSKDKKQITRDTNHLPVSQLNINSTKNSEKNNFKQPKSNKRKVSDLKKIIKRDNSSSYTDSDSSSDHNTTHQA